MKPRSASVESCQGASGFSVGGGALAVKLSGPWWGWQERAVMKTLLAGLAALAVLAVAAWLVSLLAASVPFTIVIGR